MENWILLGASRGLGRAFLEKAMTTSSSLNLTVMARKTEKLPEKINSISADFSRKENWDELITQVRNLDPHRIFYFAGGGPFGKAQDKKWKDHQWAMNVTFEFPAFLLHQYLQNSHSIQQIVLVGSSIAEEKADPNASSYCAAKHALKGFVTSIMAEQKTPFDLRLFSPGYIDTELLPANAWPRQHAGLVKSSAEVAEILWASIHNADDVNKHFVLKSSL